MSATKTASGPTDPGCRQIPWRSGLSKTPMARPEQFYVYSTGTNQLGEIVLKRRRWVMENNRDRTRPAPEAIVSLPPSGVLPADFYVPMTLLCEGYDSARTNDQFFWTITLLVSTSIMSMAGGSRSASTCSRPSCIKIRSRYISTSISSARVGSASVSSTAVTSSVLHALYRSPGLANVLMVAAIHGGKHAAPTFAGNTLYAWSEVRECEILPGCADIGALRSLTVATKNRSCSDFPGREGGRQLDPSIVRDIDWSVLMPRRVWSVSSRLPG